MEISSIIVTIAVLLPGFIAYKISNISVYSPKISTFYTTLYSILFSIFIWLIIYLVILIIPQSLGIIKNFFIESIKHIYAFNEYDINDKYKYTFNIILFFIFIYIFSFLLGYLMSILKFRFRNIYNKLYGFLFKRAQYEDVVDQIFETLVYDSSNKKIIFKTISGDFFIGEVGIVSSNLQGKYIYFSKVQKYNKNKRHFLDVADDSGFCISTSSIEYMHLSPDTDFDIDYFEPDN